MGAFGGFGGSDFATTIGKVGRSIAHGVIGGLSSAASGGSFKSGFISGAFAKGLGEAGVYSKFNVNLPSEVEGKFTTLDYVKNAIAGAVGGGVGAVVGGGKFKNGAITGSFSRLFNAVASDARRAQRERLQNKGSTELPNLPPGNYTIIVDSVSVSVGLAAFEVGDLFVVDQVGQRVLLFRYTAGGGGLGIPGVVVSREIGAITISDVRDILGGGVIQSTVAVVGVGNSTSFATSTNLDSRSGSSGIAFGLGGGSAALASDTRFIKSFGFEEAPSGLPLSGFKR